MSDKRTNTRYSYHAKIDLEKSDNSILSGEVINISVGGVLVSTEPLPGFGEKVNLHMDLPGVPKRCVIPCIVRWIGQEQGAGLQFESLRPIEVWSLNRLKRTLAVEEESG